MVDGDKVGVGLQTETAQVVGRGQPRLTGADHEDVGVVGRSHGSIMTGIGPGTAQSSAICALFQE